MLAADPFRFIAVNREALNLGDFAHAFKGLAVRLDEVLAIGNCRI
jgi:hypothetical protein